MPVYRIVDAETRETRRKIMCPLYAIRKQLGPGETFVWVDPVLEGMGITAEDAAAIDQHERDLHAGEQA